MRYLVGFVCVMALCVVGCGDECAGPLDAFWLCSDGCPTYEEAAAMPLASTGSCLDLQYVFLGGLSTKTLFFDSTGTMTAAQAIADDGSFCGGSSFIKSFGPVPSCDADECGRYWCEEGYWLRP